MSDAREVPVNPMSAKMASEISRLTRELEKSGSEHVKCPYCGANEDRIILFFDDECEASFWF